MFHGKQYMQNTRIKGIIGERIAETFLMKQGFSIIERNYNKKWGEIDIIAQKEGTLHFVEVKSVSRENITRETSKSVIPEENIHTWKQERLGRAIQTYLIDRKVPHETEWVFDTVAVIIDPLSKRAFVRFMRNVVLDLYK